MDDGTQFHRGFRRPKSERFLATGSPASKFAPKRVDSKGVNWEIPESSRSIGKSVEGRDIAAHANFDLAAAPPERATLLIGGMHGDEKATVALVEAFRERFLSEPGAVPPSVALPLANPDGFETGSRYNARGVDINRNCGYNWHPDSEEPSGPGPWSEPETRALRDFILELRPSKIVSLHWALAEIDADGPQSTGLARAMWEAMSETDRRPYRIRVYEVGQGLRRLEQTYEICPGSLGQWCGYGLRYEDGGAPAMITLELPYDPAAESRPSPLPEGHFEFVCGAWARDPEAYLAAVEGPVHEMLLAACRFDSP
jgi:hypothetical protein